MVYTHKLSNMTASETDYSIREMVDLLKLHRILVPLDGLEQSEIALPYALLFAQWLSAEVNLFHIVERTARSVQSIENVAYSDLDHDRGVQLATAYLEEIATKLKSHNAKVRWGVSSGSLVSAVVARSMIMDAGLATLTFAKEKNVPFLTDHFFRTVWNNLPIPLLCLNSSIASKLDIGISLTQPPHFVIWAHRLDVLQSVLVWAKLLFKLTNATFAIVAPLRHVRFPTFLGSRTPEYGLELDRAVAEIEELGTHVDVIFAPDQIAIGRVLQKINPFSWNITASRMMSYNLRTVFYNLLRERVPHQLLLQSTVPVLVVPCEKTSAVRRQRYHRRSQAPDERVRLPFR